MEEEINIVINVGCNLFFLILGVIIGYMICKFDKNEKTN